MMPSEWRRRATAYADVAPVADPTPIADGTKVVISDTDHYAPGQGDALWVWKSFLRGHHPILMDFGLIAGLEPAAEPPAETGVPPFAYYEPARWAMGDTRRYAERIGLIDMQPQRDLASTGYVLANPGSEYLVLDPDGVGAAFTVNLPTGSYQVEWFDVTTRETTVSDVLSIESERAVEFSSPFPPGPAVVYLNRV